MENPATWSDDARAIAAAIERFEEDCRQGIIGGSLVRAIEDDVVKPLRDRVTSAEGALADAKSAVREYLKKREEKLRAMTEQLDAFFKAAERKR